MEGGGGGRRTETRQGADPSVTEKDGWVEAKRMGMEGGNEIWVTANKSVQVTLCDPDSYVGTTAEE